MKTEITHFEKSGEDKTADVLAIPMKRHQQGDIDAIVIASSFSKNARMAAVVARVVGYDDFKVFQVHEILCKPYLRSAAQYYSQAAGLLF